MRETLIRLEGVSKRFGDVAALAGVDLSIARGEWLSVMGPSGSGKSTLMNLIAGLDLPSAGSVFVAGVEVSALDESARTRFRREQVGLVFQQFHLLPYLTAIENVMVAQHYHSVADEPQARTALQRVGLGDRLLHRPAELSGGEQQRVCIARALINQPSLLLADEPTGNLDAANEGTVLQLFEELHAEGHTIVTVTHTTRLASLSDRRVELQHGLLTDVSVPSFELERRYDEVLIQLWIAFELRQPMSVERVVLPDVVDATRTLRGMRESGLIADTSGPLAFAPRGRDRARDLIRRRRLAEVLFSSALHLPADQVEQTACLMEHVIDPNVANSICAFLGHPRRCPHNRPIPPGACCGIVEAPVRR